MQAGWPDRLGTGWRDLPGPDCSEHVRERRAVL